MTFTCTQLFKSRTLRSSANPKALRFAAMAAATGRKKGKDAQEAAIDLESPNKKPKLSDENEQETASGVQETASGVREKKVTASGVFSTQEAAASVGLRLTQPPRPVAPVEREIIQGAAKPLHGFIKELWASVTWRLSKYLYEHATVQLRKPLWKLDTPQFVKGQPGAPTSFKEPWVMANCVRSLQDNGMYEATLTLWKFAVAQTKFAGIDLGVDNVQWRQYEACLAAWTYAKLVASAGDANKRRFIFEGFVPTAVENENVVAELSKQKLTFGNDLPACGGHAMMWSLVGALDKALALNDDDPGKDEMILKLFEASLCVTCRMRLNPNEAQVTLDQMGYVDSLRVLQVAMGATSFAEFALQVLRLPGITGSESGPELVRKLETFGTTWKGQAVDRNQAYAVLSLVGIIDKPKGKAAIQFLERVDPSAMADPTKVLRVFQVVKKQCKADETEDGAVAVLESIGAAIVTGVDADSFTGDFLVPKARRSTGYVHKAIAKMKFRKWFIAEMMAACGADSCAHGMTAQGILDINRVFESPREFWARFAQQDDIEDCLDYNFGANYELNP